MKIKNKYKVFPNLQKMLINFSFYLLAQRLNYLYFNNNKKKKKNVLTGILFPKFASDN